MPRLSRKNRWSSSTGDTVEAWLHTTSSVSISRLGTLFAQAFGESFTFRLVWWALVRTASGLTRMRPEYTDRDDPSTAPLKVSSLVVSGAAWSWKVRKSSIWSSSP